MCLNTDWLAFFTCSIFFTKLDSFWESCIKIKQFPWIQFPWINLGYNYAGKCVKIASTVSNRFEKSHCGYTDRRQVRSDELWAVGVWSLTTRIKPSPAWFLFHPLQRVSGVITTHITFSHHTFPHPIPSSLTCSGLIGIPTVCCAMIWLMEFDF